MSLYIQSLFIVTLEILCCKLFFETFGEKRYKERKVRNAAIIIILIGFAFWVSNFLWESLLLKEALIILVMSLLMWAMFQMNYLKALILASLYQALLLAVDYLTFLIAVTLFNSMEEIEESYLLGGSLTVVLGKAVVFFCVILIRQKIGNKKAWLLGDTEWLKIIFFPIFSICTIIAMIYAMGGMENPKAEQICFVIAIGLAGMNIVEFYLINGILESQRQIRENELFKMQVKEQTRLYHSISESLERQRRRTHEFKNQILCIDSLVTTKNYAELEAYVRKLSGALSKELDSIQTNNVIIDAILNTKYQEAIGKKILFVIKINDLSALKISDEDIVVILSNLLNNAIEACEKCERRVVKLKFVKEDKNILLSVKNTYQGSIAYEDGEIATTKSEREEHGIGIKNIVDTIQKYNGIYTIRTEGKEFYFSILIPE